jgi:hypothetical protein
MLDLDKLEKKYGAIEYKGKKYILTDYADFTNRVCEVPNHNEPNSDGSYNFEMSCSALDEDGIEYTVYWIFLNEGQETLDQFDYEDEKYIERVELRWI